MKLAKPVYALWCGPSCNPCGPGVKDMVRCLVDDGCGNCS